MMQITTFVSAIPPTKGVGWTMMHAKPWSKATLLAAIFLVAGGGGAAFGDETSAESRCCAEPRLAWSNGESRNKFR